MTNSQQPPRYGGRALRNGVMMVGPKSIAVAIRRSNGLVATTVEPFSMPGSWARNIPFVRGLVVFPGMLLLARRASKIEGSLKQGGSRVRDTLPQFAPGLGAAIADRLTRQLSRHANPRFVVPIEAIAGVTLPFVAFGLSGRLPGVRELWRYHGAEHKAVHTAEAGLDLTPKNAARMSRIHPRCGTVFAFFGLLGGTLAKAYISSLPNGRRKAIAGALSGPLIISTAFEAVRLGNTVKAHPLGRAIFMPAWQAQRFTTAEPNAAELEVALAALQAVVDYERAHA
jgi:uncharacterized protein YqhQ